MRGEAAVEKHHQSAINLPSFFANQSAYVIGSVGQNADARVHTDTQTHRHLDTQTYRHKHVRVCVRVCVCIYKYIISMHHLFVP